MNKHLQRLIDIIIPNSKKQYFKTQLTGDDQLSINLYQSVFYQIFSNLIMNSFIHGFDDMANSEIKIEYKLNDDQLTINYADNGHGMPKEILEKVFEPFVTAKRGSGGSALGTHIIYNRVVQKLNGTLKCESELGQGTLFKIIMPVTLC